LRANFDPVPAIVAAQAVTVIAAPLVAGALLWLSNRKDIMGSAGNGKITNVLGVIGFLLLLAMAWYTATNKIPAQLEKLKAKEEETQRASDENVVAGAAILDQCSLLR
jgi:manganese transport protein